MMDNRELLKDFWNWCVENDIDIETDDEDNTIDKYLSDFE